MLFEILLFMILNLVSKWSGIKWYFRYLNFLFEFIYTDKKLD